MAMLNWEGWAANWLGWGPTGVDAPPVSTTTSGPGSAAKKRRERILVTIDGKTYEVSSHQQAQQLLARTAKKIVKKAARTPQKPASEPVAPQVDIEVPKGTDPTLANQVRAQVDAFLAQMASLYAPRARPKPRPVEEDDEDAIIALILED